MGLKKKHYLLNSNQVRIFVIFGVYFKRMAPKTF